MKFPLLVLVLAILCSLVAKSQVPINRCGSMDVDKRLRQEDPNYSKNREQIEQFAQQWIADHPAGLRTVVTIPVVFHVLYNTTAENISDDRINDQILTLN